MKPHSTSTKASSLGTVKKKQQLKNKIYSQNIFRHPCKILTAIYRIHIAWSCKMQLLQCNNTSKYWDAKTMWCIMWPGKIQVYLLDTR